MQYADDLLAHSETKEQCREDTLLKFLSSQGHKASLGKVQYWQTEGKQGICCQRKVAKCYE